MLPLPGLTAMPTVLFNAALSLVPDAGLIVRGPDALAAVAPMFNEESGAPRALASLLDQDEALDQLAISINGGSDRTAQVVRAALSERGFNRLDQGTLPDLSAGIEQWSNPSSSLRVTVIDHVWPMSKADSVNLVVANGLVAARRVLVVDGDTVFDGGFVRALKDNFYRLRFERLERVGSGAWRRGYVLEDVAMQSGAVRSLPVAAGRPQAAFISAGRDAEYAFSSVVRSGQCARLTRGPTLGRSRLFTVVGCGFVARRDSFPIPNDTQTEDHDFTLASQNAQEISAVSDTATLDHRGFRVMVNGREQKLGHYLGPDTAVVVKKVAAARFVDSAVMYTEDPPHAGGFLRQVERWHGGAIENALKRLVPRGERRGLRPNVLFALVSAQLENLLGVLLMALLPVLLGLQYGLPGARAPAASLAAWLSVDLAVTAVIVYAGAVRLATAVGGNRVSSRLAALRLTGRGIVPLLALRWLGAIGLLSAASRVLPRFGRPTTAVGKPALRQRVTVTWDRPAQHVRPKAHARTATVAAGLALCSAGLFAGVAYLTQPPSDTNALAWQYTYAAPRLEQGDHARLPVHPARDTDPRLARVGAFTRPASAAPLGASSPQVTGNGTDHSRGLSPYCDPDQIAGAANSERTLDGGTVTSAASQPTQHTPLSPWGLLVLARLVPLLSHLEEAASAYDLDAGFLLQVLLNESYLDPLAVGPTGDLGLAQLTSDALTLLRAVSTDEGSALRNEQLFAGDFSVFDPEFSLCAGAAKLAWASSQSFGDDEEVAYALYINPLHGAAGGRVAATHLEPVAAMVELRTLVELLAATVAAYRADPDAVSADERALLDIATAVAAEELDVQAAYLAAARLVSELAIDDREFYRAIAQRLYGAVPARANVTWPPGATSLARP